MRRRTDSYGGWSVVVAWLWHVSLWTTFLAEGGRWVSPPSTRTIRPTTAATTILEHHYLLHHNSLQRRVVPGARRRGVLVLNVRGGSSSLPDEDEYDDDDSEIEAAEEDEDEEDEQDEQEEEDDDEEDESSSSDDGNNVAIADDSSSSGSTTTTNTTLSLLLSVLSKTAVEVVQTTVLIVGRVVAAAWEEAPPKNEGEEDATLTQHILGTIQRMLRAALDASSSSSKNPSSTTTTRNQSGSSRDHPTESNDDVGENGASDSTPGVDNKFGIQLAKLYQVEASRYNTIDTDNDDADTNGNSNRDLAAVMGGSLKDALQTARDQARLLVVLLPASQPPKIRQPDVNTLTSFLSTPVARVCEKRPKTKKSSSSREAKPATSTTTGSFLLWSATAGSTHATAALKRLRGLQQPGRSNTPVLAVVYPALATTGMPTAKVLAQHHCSPPLSSSKMAAWLKTIQQRHVPLYRKLQQERQEQIWARERVAGYVGSVQTDREQQARAERLQEEERARQVAAVAHEAAMAARRTQLQNTMTVEPPASLDNVKTIALRLADGRTGKRRFAPEASLAEIFNWVDAEFSLERETVTLVTLNGQQSFEWLDDNDVDDDKLAMPTLQDAGLGKMVGFRVLEKKSKQEGTQDDKGRPA